MTEIFNELVVDLPAFLGYFAAAAILTLVYVVIYTFVTRHNEFELIKQNLVAASVAFSGSLLGFCLPVASAMLSSVTILGMVVWGLVALIVQIIVYLLVRMPMPRVSERIEANELAAGIWLGSASLAGGILNAASMTT